MAKQDIVVFNEDVDDTCNYCNAAKSTSTHIVWGFPFVDEVKKDLDPELAKVPRKHLLHCIQCGIAPAMKVDGHKTFWGNTSIATPRKAAGSSWVKTRRST